MKCTTADLHTMDLGTHIHLYHEWNEGTEGVWGEATVMRRHPLTLVIQPYMPTSPSATGESEFTCIAVYQTSGEGDLTELYFADSRNGIGHNYVGNGGHPDNLRSAYEAGYMHHAGQAGVVRLNEGFNDWLKRNPHFRAGTEPVKIPYEVQVKQHRIEQLEALLKVANDKIRELESRIHDAQDVLSGKNKRPGELNT